MQSSITEILVFIGVILLTIPVLGIVPKWQVRNLKDLPSDQLFKAENEARKIMAEILGGGCILLGLFFTWQTVKSTAANLHISQEGQITERFTRAIEQLGRFDEQDKPRNLAIRLGGIRGLERIANDSEKDYAAVIDILSTYIRQNASWKGGRAEMSLDEIPEPQADIQAIFSVLGRRSKSYKQGEDQRLILRGVDLRGADLDDANFRGTDFSLAHLEGIILNRAHLENALLKGANLRDAILDQAYLQGADLSGANLDHATLTGANLKGAIGLTPEQIKSAIINDKTQLP
jgi:Pentapeptide repeats (8 copies)